MGKLYTKFNLNLNLNLTRGLQIVAVTFSLAFSAIPPETSIHSFFWTKDADETVQRGCYGYTKIGNYSEKDGGYLSTFWLTNYEWWQKLFVNTYITITVRTEQGQPSKVTRASDHFKDVEWLTGFNRNGADDNIRFYFPLQPQAKPFGRYDYFTVDVNDTLDLEFYGADDNCMVGTFIHKKPDERGAVNILGRNAIIVELTDANPIRISTIRCNGEYKALLNAYLNYDLDKFAKDKEWYGISIIDTAKVEPKVVVHSVNVENGDQLEANSSTTISWETNLPSEVDSCRISASYDNKKTWQVVGSTDDESVFTWKIPNVQSDSAYIKITAYNTSGETTSDISAVLKIAANVAVHSVTVGGSTQLEADSACLISWQMDSPEDVDSCIISVSYDNKETWQKVAKTQIETEYNWVIPNVKEDSVYIKITAYDKSGDTYSTISDMLTIIPEIIVTSLTVADNEKIEADSVYKISWECNMQSEVDSCIIDVSFDNKENWENIGVAVNQTTFKWKVPNVLADSTFIRVTAACSDGMNVTEITPALMLVPEIVVDSFAIEGPTLLNADSTYEIKWAYNFPSKIDSSVLMASLDNMDSWDTLVVFDTRCGFSWKVPGIKSDSVFFKVAVYGKDGQVVETVTDTMYAIDVRSTGVLGRDRNLLPAFRTVSVGQKLKINYTLPKGAQKITLSIFDLKGRSVTKVVNVNGYIAEVGSFQIDNGIHSGYYYLRFRAEYSNGKPPIEMTRKWLKMN